MKVGFVGFGNHAKRLLECLNKCSKKLEVLNYHPTKSNINQTTNIKTLYGCNCIFITSPNDTHFKYIKTFLNETETLIFCEKPPCVNESELFHLNNLKSDFKRRIFFNFNFRFSRLSEVINKCLEEDILGKFVFVHGLISHGLAFKEGYKKTWRGQYPSEKSVVLDTSLIHLIDLFNYHLKGLLKLNHCASGSFSHGKDSVGLHLSSKSGANISLNSTYAAPFIVDFTITGTNGIIKVDDNSLHVRSPRDVFNHEGHFTTPPALISENYSSEKDYQYSIQNSVNYFFSHFENNAVFKEDDYQMSLDTMNLVLEGQNLLKTTSF